MKQKLVSNIDRVHLWNTMNVVYDMRIKDAAAKKRIKKMGFRAWLGTLPRVQLEEIRSRLDSYGASVGNYQRKPKRWNNTQSGQTSGFTRTRK